MERDRSGVGGERVGIDRRKCGWERERVGIGVGWEMRREVGYTGGGVGWKGERVGMERRNGVGGGRMGIDKEKWGGRGRVGKDRRSVVGGGESRDEQKEWGGRG